MVGVDVAELVLVWKVMMVAVMIGMEKASVVLGMIVHHSHKFSLALVLDALHQLVSKNVLVATVATLAASV